MPSVRVLRSNAILLRLALRRVMRMAGSEREQIPEDLAAFERLVIEAVIDEGAHQRLCLLLSLGIGVVVASHVETSPARDPGIRTAVLHLDPAPLPIGGIRLPPVDPSAARAVGLWRPC